MKKLRLIVLSLVMLLSFGVFANGGTATISKENTEINGNQTEKFIFQHNVEYFEPLEQRLINYSNRDQPVVQHLSISNFECEVIFHDGISDEIKEETLLFLVQGLSFNDFIIE